VWLLLAPLLPGIINKVKAWVAGRRGPPVLQLYYDLAKLWRKGVVLSTLASPGFVAGPAVAWVALTASGDVDAPGAGGRVLSFRGDVLLLIYLLALARFCTAWAAMETGSAFEGMGAAREVSYAVLAEAAIIAAVLSLSVQTGSVSLVTMLSPSAGAGAVLLAAGLFTVLLAENCRVPFDDPNTHLELTMIHEVMVLDHSGPPLAAILHGASVKLLLFAVLLVQAVLPMGKSSPWSPRRAGGGRAGRDGERGAGGIIAGAARVSSRAAAAHDGVFVLFVCAAGRVERRCRMSGGTGFESSDRSGDGIEPARAGQQPAAVAHPRHVRCRACCWA
jgi:formate hydrogenlyase subunit 4